VFVALAPDLNSSSRTHSLSSFWRCRFRFLSSVSKPCRHRQGLIDFSARQIWFPLRFLPTCSFWSALERLSILDLVISRAKYSCSKIEISPQSTRPIEFLALTHFACPVSCTWCSFWSHGLCKHAWIQYPSLTTRSWFLWRLKAPVFAARQQDWFFARGLFFFVRFWLVRLLEFAPGLCCQSALASRPGFTPVPVQFVLAAADFWPRSKIRVLQLWFLVRLSP
jgi:hypothetical protein